MPEPAPVSARRGAHAVVIAALIVCLNGSACAAQGIDPDAPAGETPFVASERQCADINVACVQQSLRVCTEYG